MKPAMRGFGWLPGLVGCVLMSGCSGLLGLDEFNPGETSGGSSGAAGAGGSMAGTGATNGSGGTGAAGAGGTGAQGAGATGGSSAGGTGADGGTNSGGAAGAPECAPTQTEGCYEGPSGTEGVARCKAGVRTCTSASVWGSCQGQILPAVEDCSVVSVDENCDGFECGIWGGAYPLSIGQVAAFQGGAVVAGTYDNAQTVGGHVLPFAGGTADAFVAAVDDAGALSWITPVGSTGNDGARRLGVGPDGVVYAIVVLPSPVNLGDGAKPGGNRLVKFSPTGAIVWTLELSSKADYNAVAVDPSGNAVIVGSLDGSATYGSYPLTSDNIDPFLVKVSGSGSVLWAKAYVASEDNFAEDGVVDSSGNIFFVGSMYGSLDFGGGPRNAISRDAYIVELDPDGHHLASHTFGGSGDVRAQRVSLDASGVPIVSGVYTTTYSNGGQSLPTVSTESVFVTRLTPGAGTFMRWQASVPNLRVYDIAADPSGAASIVGQTNGATTLSGLSVESNVGVVKKFGSMGEDLWARALGGPIGYAWGADTTAGGELLVVGTTASALLDVGFGEMTLGPNRSYLVKLGK